MNIRFRIGVSVSLASIIGFGREFILNRPPGDSLAVLWDVISPTSLYLMFVVVGVVFLLFFLWPVLERVYFFLFPSVAFVGLRSELDNLGTHLYSVRTHDQIKIHKQYTNLFRKLEYLCLDYPKYKTHPSYFHDLAEFAHTRDFSGAKTLAKERRIREHSVDEIAA